MTVYGQADADALLKKMRRHLDKHAMFWRTLDGAEVAHPLLSVDPPALHAQSRTAGLEHKSCPKLRTDIPSSVDTKDGRPLVQPREVHQVERETRGSIQNTQDRSPVPRDTHGHGEFPGAGKHGHEGPQKVVFVHADASVDPLRAHATDPHDGNIRSIAAHEPPDAMHSNTSPRGKQLSGSSVMHSVATDPREGRPLTPPYGRPMDPREMQRPVHPRDEMRPIYHTCDGSPFDPHATRSTDRRDQLPLMDPHMRRPAESVDHREMMRPADPRMTRTIDPRDMRTVDPRKTDPRDERSIGATSYRRAPEQHPRSGTRVPEGLVPVRTGRDSRELNLISSDPREPRLSPIRGQYPEQNRPLSPREQDQHLSRSPRQALDHGPRSPRDYHQPDYAQRESSREMLGPQYGSRGFSEGTGHASRASDRARVPGTMPAYRTVDPRVAAAYEFQGYSEPRGEHAYPRGSAGGPSEVPPQVRTYGDFEPGELDMTLRELHQDMTELDGELRRLGHDIGRFLPDGFLRQYAPQHSESRRREADPRDHQPKQNYYSDYKPSQNYQPGPLSSQEIDEVPITNPNYKKHINNRADQY